jgi:hypothetical protein
MAEMAGMAHIFSLKVRFFTLTDNVSILATSKTKDLSHLKSVIKAPKGEPGLGKCCHGKSAKHEIIPVSLSISP